MKLGPIFSNSRQLQNDLERVSQEMYRRNSELAETNKTLALLQKIDTLALGADDSLTSLCQKVAQAIVDVTSYAFVGVLSRPTPSDTKVILHGWSIQDSALQASFKFTTPPHINLDREWFGKPESRELLSLESWPLAQMAAALNCPEAELQALVSKVPIKSVYIVKLIARQRLVGLIMIGLLSDTVQLAHADTHILDHLSDSVGIALDNKLLAEENQHILHQLENENGRIEHTVEVRTKELHDAEEQLQATDRMKTEFMVLTSHNLRTPIAILHGNVELLEVSGMSENQMRSVAGIRTSVERLKEFVDELLTISSIEAGTKLALETVRIEELLAPLITETKAEAAAKGVGLTLTSDAANTIVQVNVPLLREVLRNLLGNAVKFTEHGSITVTTGLENSSFFVTVTDTGIGIAPEEIPHLFTMFHRGTPDPLRYDVEGKGIGLYFTKLVVEEHGGTIQASSNLGKGSEFRVTIPINPRNESNPTTLGIPQENK